jgi:hypothetical protein
VTPLREATIALLLLGGGCATPGRPEAGSEALPALYFELMKAGMDSFPENAEVRVNANAVFTAAVLYAKPNPSRGDASMLARARSVGDLLAVESESGRLAGWLNHRWVVTLWLDAYRLLVRDLGDERRARWRRELERHVQEIAADVAERIDYPRYQSPFIRTSPNHLSIWASTLHLAGKLFANRGWESLGARAMRRFAAEEQTPDGFWGEHNDSGPTTGYNYLTFTSMALYYEHSGDREAFEALRRGKDFHLAFTYPDGTPVEVINDRNRHWDVSPWGHFGFSHFPDGRRYAAFLMERLRGRTLSQDALGRLAQNALYFHEGPQTPIPQDLDRFVHRLRVPAAIRRSRPWTVCLSALISTQAVTNQFYLDRQGHVSVFHDRLGLIVTGANSKRQPELATFSEKARDQVHHLPTSSRLEMGYAGDRLSLSYNTFFADLRVEPPSERAIAFEVAVVERGRMEEARLTLQLRLRPGEALQTAGMRATVGDQRIEIEPEELGGMIRHAGWTLKVDPSARLVWPVFPFNPYANGPETRLEHAVAALSIPLHPKPVAGMRSRGQTVAFRLEAAE